MGLAPDLLACHITPEADKQVNHRLGLKVADAVAHHDDPLWGEFTAQALDDLRLPADRVVG